MKYKTIENIADLYLKHLHKAENKNSELFSLDKLLEEKKIFFDKKKLNSVIFLLKEESLIEEVENKNSIYSYSNSKEGLSLSEASKKGDIEGIIKYYRLSNLGRKFTESKQVLGIEKKIAKRKKWIERFISFIIGVLATIITSLVLHAIGIA